MNKEWLTTRPGEHCLVRVSAKDTHGLYSLVEIVSDPGDGTPMHIHEREDEHIAVLEGTARIAYGDKVFDCRAGDIATLRKGISHAWGNRSSAPLRIGSIARLTVARKIKRDHAIARCKRRLQLVTKYLSTGRIAMNQ